MCVGVHVCVLCIYPLFLEEIYNRHLITNENKRMLMNTELIICYSYIVTH